MDTGSLFSGPDDKKTIKQKNQTKQQQKKSNLKHNEQDR